MGLFPASLLIANRGEIARRIIRTGRRLGIRTIAVYHEVDADMPFVAEADEAVELRADVPVKAYLDVEQVLASAAVSGAEALHPGYGFLAENADFARAVADSGMLWIGPSPESMIAMADKIEARRTVAAVGVPTSGDGGAIESIEQAAAEADRVGYPVMVKASAGGGGIGMAVANNSGELAKVFEGTRSMAQRSFGSDRVFVERYIAKARHIEVQILGRADGEIITLGERDCSAPRRHQTIVADAPAPEKSAVVRAKLAAAARAAASSVGYQNAGTVEFLLDTATHQFIFLEMNTRIQVEHPITELVTGVDLVEQQLSIAATGKTTDDFAPAINGHAIEFRVCAEDPVRFFPSPGPIETWQLPAGDGIRIDAGYAADTAVTPHFDSLVAKLCVHAPTRDAAIELGRQALAASRIAPLKTNLPFLQAVAQSAQFAAGRYDTGLVAELQQAAAPQPKKRKAPDHE
ncbi:MAG: acetyl/propionyl/methylcrotonyl-CoA carboxylase subunit alpha [Cumulibacter sp.]